MIHDPTLTSVHDYWKAIDLSIWIFVSKVISLVWFVFFLISLVFNTLPRFVTAFLPKSKSILISWLQSLSSDFGAQKCKMFYFFTFYFYFQFSLVQSCKILCNSMDCSTPGLPVHHQFSELTQTHVHWVGDDIQPSHPLSSPSPPTFNH